MDRRWLDRIERLRRALNDWLDRTGRNLSEVEREYLIAHDKLSRFRSGWNPTPKALETFVEPLERVVLQLEFRTKPKKPAGSSGPPRTMEQLFDHKVAVHTSRVENAIDELDAATAINLSGEMVADALGFRSAPHRCTMCGNTIAAYAAVLNKLICDDDFDSVSRGLLDTVESYTLELEAEALRSLPEGRDVLEAERIVNWAGVVLAALSVIRTRSKGSGGDVARTVRMALERLASSSALAAGEDPEEFVVERAEGPRNLKERLVDNAIEFTEFLLRSCRIATETELDLILSAFRTWDPARFSALFSSRAERSPNLLAALELHAPALLARTASREVK